jgi:hypothetical protein
MQQDGHSVPRLYKLSYLEVALRQIDEGANFDRIRQTLIAHAAQNAAERMILRGSRDPHTFWSPTQESLAELMRLNFVRSETLPSERKYVDIYRNSTYELTPEGLQAAERLKRGDPHDRANFLDMLSIALAEAHPGFQYLLSAVERYPLCIPEYTLEKISRLTQEGSGTNALAEDAIARMTEHWPEGIGKPDAASMVSAITEALRRRFPPAGSRRPSQKDVLDTVDDAVLAFTARARNVRLDAISFNVCMSWASQLAVLEESRYVEDWHGRTVWVTAQIGAHTIRRRGFKEASDAVVEGLGEGFKKVAKAVPEPRSSGSLPIYRVRAQAAFAARVNLRFVDMVLARILSGDIETPYENPVVALGSGLKPPPSEPVFTYQGRRFFEIVITDRESSPGLGSELNSLKKEKKSHA